MAMKTAAALVTVASLAGCALPPLTPEQAAYLRANPIYTPQQPYVMQTQQRQAPVTQYQSLTQTAYFTGQRQQVTTITNQQGWQCQYRLGARLFDRVYVGECPSSIEVQ